MWTAEERVVMYRRTWSNRNKKKKKEEEEEEEEEEKYVTDNENTPYMNTYGHVLIM